MKDKLNINQFQFYYEYQLAKKAVKKNALKKRNDKGVKRKAYTPISKGRNTMNDEGWDG